MFRKRNKSEVQAEYTCSVRFLDDEPMQFTFKKDTIGQWLLDRVSEKLNLIEKDYFGLRYIDTDKQRHWLDPLKTVYKQLKGITPIVLCFRVKFYPEDPMKLREEITRYYMFLQLRRDLHHGRLLCSPDDAVYLAAYIVQSEVGDYDPEDHPPGYISEFKMLPKQTPRLEERVMEQHRALRGQVPAEAEGNFLKRACTLDTYGVDPHQVKDQKADMLYLGITYQGIMTFRGSRRTQLYKWTQIRRLSYEGKMFIVNVSVNEEGDLGPPKKKQQPVTYKCQTASAAKYLWRSAVEQQLFFTLASASTAPKLRSGGSLFSRGSKFRFSGRCQSEAYEASQRIHRQEPNFPRSSSLPSFNRRHGSASSRSSAVVGHNDSSILDDSTTSDDHKRNKVIWASGKKPEVAVDVPRGLTMMMPPTYQSEVRVESKTIRAPLAPQETYEEQPQDPEEPYKERRKDTEQQTREIKADAEIIIPASVAIVSSAPPPQLNGQVVREVVRDRLGSQEDEKGDVSFGSESYKPNSTFDNFDVDETEPKSLVMEEMQQTVVNPASAKHNHLADGLTPTTVLDPPTPNAIDSPTPAPNPIKKRQGSGCGAVVGSVLVAVLLLATLLYVLYFSGWQHPLLTQARSHLTFLEPARDLLARHGQELVTFFSN